MFQTNVNRLTVENKSDKLEASYFLFLHYLNVSSLKEIMDGPKRFDDDRKRRIPSIAQLWSYIFRKLKFGEKYHIKLLNENIRCVFLTTITTKHFLNNKANTYYYLLYRDFFLTTPRHKLHH